MTYLFSLPQPSLADTRRAASAFEAAGYDPDRLRFGPSLSAFARSIPQGSTVVVLSLACFPSLMELFSTLSELSDRRIALRSVAEPWLSQEVSQTADLLARLRELAAQMHTERTKAGLAKARAEGRTPGRPRKQPRTPNPNTR